VNWYGIALVDTASPGWRTDDSGARGRLRYRALGQNGRRVRRPEALRGEGEWSGCDPPTPPWPSAEIAIGPSNVSWRRGN